MISLDDADARSQICNGTILKTWPSLSIFDSLENGVVSINLPISEQLVGARTKRTAHPLVLNYFEKFFSVALGKPIAVENSFIWKTKRDVIHSIVDHGCGELKKDTISCTQTYDITKLYTHCGCCSRCLDRRFAVLASNAGKYDPTDMYKVDIKWPFGCDGAPYCGRKRRRGLGPAVTPLPNGFRTAASSIFNESGLWHADAIERQLAHAENDSIRRAYARADFWEERVRMMMWWSDYCEKHRQGQNNHVAAFISARSAQR